MTKDEMVGWHHWLEGHEFDYALELVTDREAWRAAVHWVAKSWTRLSDWTDWLMDFPGGTVVKNLPANVGDARDVGWILASGRSPGVENGNPLQYSCLKILACLSHGQRSLAGWSPSGHKELDMTDRLSVGTPYCTSLGVHEEWTPVNNESWEPLCHLASRSLGYLGTLKYLSYQKYALRSPFPHSLLAIEFLMYNTDTELKEKQNNFVLNHTILLQPVKAQSSCNTSLKKELRKVSLELDCCCCC